MATMIRPASWPTADRIAPILAALQVADNELDEFCLEISPLVGRQDRFVQLDDAPTPSFEHVGVLSALIAEASDELESMRMKLDGVRKIHEAAVVFAVSETSPQPCRACGTLFPYDPDADYCPSCAAENAGTSEAEADDRG